METNTTWKCSVGAFRSLAKFLEDLSDDERNRLILGDLKISFSLQESSSTRAETTTWDATEVVKTLTEFSVRDDAENWIKHADLSKKQLHQALKSIDVPWDKTDKVERLREKLIENTIGFKLRSKAIQGS